MSMATKKLTTSSVLMRLSLSGQVLRMKEAERVGCVGAGLQEDREWRS